MAKKNEFIFNICFNRENQDHVKAAGILNRLGHGKAEYLARAVLAYESRELDQGNASAGIDYYTLEQMVRKILGKQMEQKMPHISKSGIQEAESNFVKSYEIKKESIIEEHEMEEIMMALENFRK